MAEDKAPADSMPASPKNDAPAATIPAKAAPSAVRAEAHKIGTEAVERALSDAAA